MRRSYSSHGASRSGSQSESGPNRCIVSDEKSHGIRSGLDAAHQPSRYIARLPNISKYCVVCRSGASGSLNEYAKLVPSIGSCAMPSTVFGSGMPATSRTVGAMSMTWVNCVRSLASGAMCFGQAIAIGSRVPPRWLAICLPH